MKNRSNISDKQAPGVLAKLAVGTAFFAIPTCYSFDKTGDFSLYISFEIDRQTGQIRGETEKALLDNFPTEPFAPLPKDHTNVKKLSKYPLPEILDNQPAQATLDYCQSENDQRSSLITEECLKYDAFIDLPTLFRKDFQDKLHRYSIRECSNLHLESEKQLLSCVQSRVLPLSTGEKN